jgi:hypothetical protein
VLSSDGENKGPKTFPLNVKRVFYTSQNTYKLRFYKNYKIELPKFRAGLPDGLFSNQKSQFG